MNRQQIVRIVAMLAASALVLWQLPLYLVMVAQRIAYAFPIDYGEGPLMRQVQFLHQGGTIATLYGDPGQVPFVVVNYPPMYLLVSAIIGWVMPILQAGRLVSALAGIAVMVAIASLNAHAHESKWTTATRWLAAATWLAIPIVREWSGVMRVDMLGVALGLWGVYLAWRGRLNAGTILLALALLCKPSLIAAPLALLVLLIRTPWRNAASAVASGAGIIALVAAGITLGGGNVWLHLVQANTNSWDATLARTFWREAWHIHWPLIITATVIAIAHLRHGRQLLSPSHLSTTMAIAYTIGGIIIGIGIGKVGAYANYFLEWYAGMIWLVVSAVSRTRRHDYAIVFITICSLTVARYFPLWSETYAKPYGMIEQQRPARIVVGSYGVWQDLRREGHILAANAVTATDLNDLIHTHGSLVFTDVPGIAAQANAMAPMQVFEHRMLHDAGLWDQRPLLRQLANGSIPLVVLDYLGNWMTRESIQLISTRYAQSGSRGSYDIYQPIAVGAPQLVNQRLGDATLVSSALPPPLNRPAYEPGSVLPVLLTWASTSSDRDIHQVTVSLVDVSNRTYTRRTQPLFAGALTLADIGDGTLQHMHALEIPTRVADGTYRLMVQLDTGPQVVAATMSIQRGTGRTVGEPGIFVPSAFMEYIATHGSYVRWGLPIMPAMPFSDMTLQCWSNGCVVRHNDGTIRAAPLGEWLRGAFVLMPEASASESYDFTHAIAIDTRFTGDAYTMTDRARRENDTLLWLRQAVVFSMRDDAVSIADGGARVLRLPGIPYRWPAPSE
ncbi:MAG: glycosyltransferase 87 family protein [Roseiflexaceae bacterium]